MLCTMYMYNLIFVLLPTYKYFYIMFYCMFFSIICLNFVLAPIKSFYDMDANSMIDNSNMYNFPTVSKFYYSVPVLLNTGTELNTIIDTTGTRSSTSNFDLLNIPLDS
uniref:Uncharacterized protein n=1 Tax=Schizaphis graminum TaxID=13262 RepID=A0A2S2PMJ0_SCHGA